MSIPSWPWAPLIEHCRAFDGGQHFGAYLLDIGIEDIQRDTLAFEVLLLAEVPNKEAHREVAFGPVKALDGEDEAALVSVLEESIADALVVVGVDVL